MSNGGQGPLKFITLRKEKRDKITQTVLYPLKANSMKKAITKITQDQSEIRVIARLQVA